MTKIQYVTFEVENYTVHYYGRDFAMPVLLQEARRRGQPLGGPYSFRKDRAHSTVGQDHIHVYKRGNQLFALNFDGTAHDQSHGAVIPKKVADELRRRFPDVTIPPTNVIESDEGHFEFLASILE